MELGESFVKLLRSKFNTSQYDAIVAAATTSGFTLIKVRLLEQRSSIGSSKTEDMSYFHACESAYHAAVREAQREVGVGEVGTYISYFV